MTFLKNHILTILGVALGAVGGYLYYHFIGCAKGCAITSDPVNSMLYGSVMGGLFLNIFKRESKTIAENNYENSCKDICN